MMENFNRFGNMNPPPEYKDSPYLMFRNPFRIAGNLYYVGNEWCASHLIDTGDGLILLDTPVYGGFPGLVRNITELGYKLSELKIILISHSHTDHFGCAQALRYMTGAKIYLGRVDAEYMASHPALVKEMNDDLGYYNNDFKPDVLVEDGDVITLGNTTIRCVMCPGHTKGVMSHFWTLEEDGKTYNVGIYGGAGFGTVSTGYLQHYDLPMSLQEEFPKSIDKVWDEKVDIMLGNHPFHNDTFQKQASRKEGEPNPFIDPTEWHRFLTELKEGYYTFFSMTPEQARAAGAKTQWTQYYGVHAPEDGIS